MRALTLLVRNLAALELANDQQPVPALDAFLSRCHVETDSHDSTIGWICASFGITRQQDWPAGPILAQALGAKNESAYWICAQPVHLEVNRDDLILQPVSQLRLSEEESRTLFSVVKSHFADDLLEMEHVDTGLWCVGAGRAQRLSTTEIDLAQGRSVDGLLPSGEDAQWWQRLVMEAQMTLHEHPVNVAREQRGEAPVNSLWIWGGGTPAVVHKGFDKMCVVDPLLRAAAILSHTQLIETPVKVADFLVDGRGFFEFNLQTNDKNGASLSVLDSEWISPAWQALRNGRLDQLTVVLALPNAMLICRCDRKARRRFWKRTQPLHRFLARWQLSP